jgi:hypothetical protein
MTIVGVASAWSSQKKPTRRLPALSSTPMSKNTRRCLVNRFPFGVIYQLKSDRLHIVAIADLRRHPEYWLNRH